MRNVVSLGIGHKTKYGFHRLGQFSSAHREPVELIGTPLWIQFIKPLGRRA
jgi:hypothetical protein